MRGFDHEANEPIEARVRVRPARLTRHDRVVPPVVLIRGRAPGKRSRVTPAAWRRPGMTLSVNEPSHAAVLTPMERLATDRPGRWAWTIMVTRSFPPAARSAVSRNRAGTNAIRQTKENAATGRIARIILL